MEDGPNEADQKRQECCVQRWGLFLVSDVRLVMLQVLLDSIELEFESRWNVEERGLEIIGYTQRYTA